MHAYPKRKDGTTEWIPPPHLDHGQPRTNTFHHPEKLLAEEAEEDEEDDPYLPGLFSRRTVEDH